jgi:hypothetical protein
LEALAFKAQRLTQENEAANIDPEMAASTTTSVLASAGCRLLQRQQATTIDYLKK